MMFGKLIHTIFIAVGAGFGLSVCIFVALFVAYMIWATAAGSGER